MQQLFSSIIVYNSRTYGKSSFIIFVSRSWRRESRDRGCFASSKQQEGDVLEILFSTTVSLTNGYSTFRSCIVHAEYVWRKDRENGNGPRRKPPLPTPDSIFLGVALFDSVSYKLSPDSEYIQGILLKRIAPLDLSTPPPLQTSLYFHADAPSCRLFHALSANPLFISINIVR